MKRTIFLLLTALPVLWSCTERIDIDLDDSYTRLVVDGGITNEPGHHTVRLTTTTGYFYNQDPPAVSGALVKLALPKGSIDLQELSGKKGYYAMPEVFSAEPGTEYELRITLRKEINNAIQYHARAKMPDTQFRLDSIQMEYNPGYDFWLVKVYAQDPPTRDFYKFETYLKGIGGNDTTMRAVATSDRFFNGRNTNGFAVAFFDGEILSAGDTINLAMSAITEDYYSFYSEMRNESGYSNPLFAGPPANIRSNLKEGGLGYFWTRKTSRTSLIVPDWRKK